MRYKWLISACSLFTRLIWHRPLTKVHYPAGTFCAEVGEDGWRGCHSGCEAVFRTMSCRKLIVLNSDGNVTCKFGPLESSICGLEWGPHGHLYIDLGTKLLTTSCNESQPLLPLHAEPTTALSVSTKASFLALGVASPTLGFQVSVLCMIDNAVEVVHLGLQCLCSCVVTRMH